MAWNGRTQSKTTSQDYMNLLYSDSDSDHVPDLKLPPIKGKRQKRKRSPTGSSRAEENSCGAWSILRVFLYVVLLSSILMLAILGFWALFRLNRLENTIKKLQSSDSGSVDVLSLKSQLANVNSSLIALKTGPLQTVDKRLTVVEEQLKELNTKTSELDKSMSAYQDLITLPQKVTDLTKTVATIGNNAAESKKNIGQLSDRLAALETPTHSTKPTSGGTQTGNSVPSLEAEIAELNVTLQSQVHQIKQTLLEFSDKLSSDEIDTRTSSSNSEIESLVNDLVKKMLTNWTKESHPSGRDSQSELNQLSQQVSTIMEDVTKLQRTGISVMKEGDFLTFQDATQENLQYVNSSLSTINMELDKLSGQVQVLDKSVLNLTDIVGTWMSPTGEPSHSAPEKTNNEETQDKTSSTTTPNSSSSGSPVEAKTISTKLVIGAKIPSTPASAGTNEAGSLHIEGVSTLQDLLAKLEGLPKNDNGQYSLDTLTPLVNSPDLLSQYDQDSNGMYSLSELRSALGFRDREGR